ncbi:MAG: hypothetical protein GXP58_00160 [Deltaproteobacteria bacterium]|nr:hypothetical protein [Deltaproteobacteria bacterium]
MSLRQLRAIQALYFTYQDVADLLKITPQSAMVTCSRYVRSGDLVRLKRNYYIPRERWSRLAEDQIFVLANMLQVPSYISLTTALVFYGYTTQIQRDYIESVAVKRTREFRIEEVTFSFTKIKKDYYSDFIKKEGFFIATPEKALIDTLYLESLGRYRLDIGSIDFSKFDNKVIRKVASRYTDKVRQRAEELCGT